MMNKLKTILVSHKMFIVGNVMMTIAATLRIITALWQHHLELAYWAAMAMIFLWVSFGFSRIADDYKELIDRIFEDLKQMSERGGSRVQPPETSTKN